MNSSVTPSFHERELAYARLAYARFTGADAPALQVYRTTLVKASGRHMSRTPQKATRWAVHGMVTTANKSVRMNYHWVQEAVEDGFVDMRRVPTADNTSDIFTKTLGEVDITRLRPGLTGYGPLPPVPDAMPT